jgi:hypothetical protein
MPPRKIVRKGEKKIEEICTKEECKNIPVSNGLCEEHSIKLIPEDIMDIVPEVPIAPEVVPTPVQPVEEKMELVEKIVLSDNGKCEEVIEVIEVKTVEVSNPPVVTNTNMEYFTGTPTSLEEFFSIFSKKILIELLEAVHIRATAETPRSLMIAVMTQKVIYRGVRDLYPVVDPSVILRILKSHQITIPKGADIRTLYFDQVRKFHTIADFFSPCDKGTITDYIDAVTLQPLVHREKVECKNLSKTTLEDILAELMAIEGMFAIFITFEHEFLNDIAEELGVILNSRHGDDACVLKILDVLFRGLYKERIDDRVYQIGYELLEKEPDQKKWENWTFAKLDKHIRSEQMSGFYDAQLEYWLTVRDLKVGKHIANCGTVLKFLKDGIGNVNFVKTKKPVPSSKKKKI